MLTLPKEIIRLLKCNKELAPVCKFFSFLIFTKESFFNIDGFPRFTKKDIRVETIGYQYLMAPTNRYEVFVADFDITCYRGYDAFKISNGYKILLISAEEKGDCINEFKLLGFASPCRRCYYWNYLPLLSFNKRMINYFSRCCGKCLVNEPAMTPLILMPNYVNACWRTRFGLGYIG